MVHPIFITIKSKRLDPGPHLDFSWIRLLLMRIRNSGEEMTGGKAEMWKW